MTVQEITGTLTAEDPATFFELNPVKAGDTLSVFAEATSGDLAPIVILTDFGDKPLATGNFSGQQTEGTLQFVFDEDGSGYTWTNDRDGAKVVWLLRDAVLPDGRTGEADKVHVIERSR